MTAAIGLLPLLVAVAVAALLPLATLYPRIDTRLTRMARRYFVRYVPQDAPDRRRNLRAAFVDQAYRSYAARTYLVTVLAAVAGAVFGVYLAGAGLLVLPAIGEFINQLPNAIANGLGRPSLDPDLTERQVLLVTVVGGVSFGTLSAGATYWYRWEQPRSHAEVRRRGINEGLPRTVAFVYALSRGGMAVPEVLRTLARNRGVYGHGADEISVAVREMDLFGSDMITAVRHTAERTPSQQFKTFAENLASVLQSGQNLSEFLREQYERYQEEALDRQREVLELLATIAEAYVTVLVAGTLFLMTILLVFGLTISRTLGLLRLLAYAMIPLANLLFVVYLSGKLQLLGVDRGNDTGSLAEAVSDRRSMPAVASRLPDGGSVHGADWSAQLERYDAVRSLKRVVDRPLATVLRQPTSILAVTVPLALLWIAVRAPPAFADGTVNVRLLDDTLVQATLFVVGTFAVVWELYSRRIAEMERQLPELLERLASLNEAGMSIVESLDRVRGSDLGVLSTEVDWIWRDVQYGANVDDALRRFGLRVRTTATTRVVTLLTNALRASGNLGPILRIAAEQADAELRLRRQRRQQMITYLVVIYVAFAVFLLIILSVQEVLVPSLPNNVPTPSSEQTTRLGVNAGAFGRFGQVDKAAYTLVFFHTALVQAVFSGFIGGQLGEGSLKDGAKHAAVMLGVAYLAFVFLTSPVAQVTFTDQTAQERTVVVDSVSLSEGGFVVVREKTPDGAVVGHSGYLAPGSHENVRVSLERTYSDEMQLFAVPYLDADGDEAFDAAADRQYPSRDAQIFDEAEVQRDRSERANRNVEPRPVSWRQPSTQPVTVPGRPAVGSF